MNKAPKLFLLKKGYDFYEHDYVQFLAESLYEHDQLIKDQQNRIAVEYPEPFTYSLFEKMAPFLLIEPLVD